MPLGLFGSSSNHGPKPQPLTSEKEKKEKGSTSSSNPGSIDLKDCKGASIKLGKKSFTVEKKLAEGGFAIVYLVCDKHNRYYALKRQLIRDDPRQVDACRTECQIVKNLNGHKNIVAYVDHQLSVNKAGIYDYMLLTVYYKTNVLQLMNSRLLANRWLTINEILDIFCDMCEAVARLHHSKTPVVHRDLKVENVLIDQRTGSEKPVYILCDFGSATTKILTQETHSQSYMEEEIKRYTTLSYRAPEMIDLFCGVPIDTKSDIWAMGVMLYKLCYFALPFGESALAIQNGTFTFPENPTIPDEIKAIINLLLTSNAKHRPNIFQASYLAFSATNKKCPVYNIEKSPRIELLEAVQILKMRDKLGSNYARALEKAFNEFEARKKLKENTNQACTSFANENHDYHQVNIAAQVQSPIKTPVLHASPQFIPRTPVTTSVVSPTSKPLNEGIIVNTSEPNRVLVNSTEATAMTTTTSVNPRLRPKPTTTVTGIFPTPISGPPVSPRMDQQPVTPTPSRQGPPVPLKPSTSNTNLQTRSSVSDTPDASMPMNRTLEAFDSMKISQISTESSKSAPDYVTAAKLQNTKVMQPSQFVVVSSSATLPTTSLHSSAFQPYSMAYTKKQVDRPPRLTEKEQRTISVSSNPFLEAPFAPGSPGALDDNAFGERFDEIRRVNRRNTIAIAHHGQNPSNQQERPRLPDSSTNPYTEIQLDPELCRIIEEDPFGAAPIHPNQCLSPTTITSSPLPNQYVVPNMVNSQSRGHLRTMSTPHWNH